MEPAAIPERIGRYRVLGELGRGAMGRVYVAYDPNLERRVALKVMSPAAGEDPEEEEELRQRFLLEARAAGRLAHPGIVAVHDADTDPASGLPYIAMELVEGESLEALLRREGRLPELLAVDLVARIARALGFAHARGIVHRDVKPANILLAGDGAAKIADFGIAKLGGLGVTRAGRVLGSPFFMSPEQVQGLAVDGRSDLFSLGGVLYRAVTGELPFPGDGLVTVAFKVVQVDPRPIDPALGLLPRLADLIGRSMAKDPARRYATADEMAADLEAIARELSDPAGSGARAASAVAAAAARLVARGAPAPDGEGGSARRSGTPFDRGETLVLDGDGSAPPLPLAATPVPRRRRGGLAGRRASLAVGALLLVAAAAVGAWWASAPPERPPLAGERRTAAAVERAPPEPDAPGIVAPTTVPEPAGSEPAAGAPRLAADAAPPEPSPSGPPAEPLAAEVAPAAEPTATLYLAYRNRLGSATLSVRVDGREIWSRQIETGPSPLLRAFGDEVLETLTVPAGEREVEVRVRGHSKELDAAATISGSFDPGGRRWLRVSLNPFAEKIKLAWAAQ